MNVPDQLFPSGSPPDAEPQDFQSEAMVHLARAARRNFALTLATICAVSAATIFGVWQVSKLERLRDRLTQDIWNEQTALAETKRRNSTLEGSNKALAAEKDRLSAEIANLNKQKTEVTDAIQTIAITLRDATEEIRHHSTQAIVIQNINQAWDTLVERMDKVGVKMPELTKPPGIEEANPKGSTIGFVTNKSDVLAKLALTKVHDFFQQQGCELPPGIVVTSAIHSPTLTQVRYFNPEFQAIAQTLSKLLKKEFGIESRVSYVIDRDIPKDSKFFQISFAQNVLKP